MRLIASRKIIWLDSDTTLGLVSVGPGQGVEGRKLVPSGTNFLLLFGGLILVAVLGAADVCTSEWNTEHVEVHDLSNRVFQVLPSSPLSGAVVLSVLTSAREGAGTTDQLSVVSGWIVAVVRFVAVQDFSGGLGLHVAEERVHIILHVGHTGARVRVRGVQGNGPPVQVGVLWNERQIESGVTFHVLGPV